MRFHCQGPQQQNTERSHHPVRTAAPHASSPTQAGLNVIIAEIHPPAQLVSDASAAINFMQ